MFKLTKKKKLQENENVEKNENIEKNENTAVNSETISENPQSIFPSASTTFENTQKEWKNVTSEELIKEIQYCSKRGFRGAEFYHSTISEELVNELRAQGYTVNVHEATEKLAPYFKIYW